MSSIPPKIFPFPSRFTLPANVVVPRSAEFPVGALIKKAYWPFSVVFDAVPEIRTTALALLDASVREVATMVTLPPVGTVAGAVYAVMLLLGVEVGLKAPHAVAGVQLQFTPRAAGSFWTVAAMLAVPVVASHAGGIVESVTETDCGAGPGPGELPPPQPEIAATMPMARRDKFLFTVRSERGKSYRLVSRSIANPAQTGSIRNQRCLRIVNPAPSSRATPGAAAPKMLFLDWTSAASRGQALERVQVRRAYADAAPRRKLFAILVSKIVSTARSSLDVDMPLVGTTVVTFRTSCGTNIDRSARTRTGSPGATLLTICNTAPPDMPGI